MDEHRTDRRASRYPVARAIRLKLEIRHICIARFGFAGAVPSGDASRVGLAQPPALDGRQLPAPPLFAGSGPPAAPGAWLARAENVGRGKVVPGTTLADLDHVYPELPVFGRHLGQFRPLLNPAGILAEFVPIHVGDVGQLGPAADRAGRIGGFTMELGRAEQIGVRVADVRDRSVPGQHRGERCPPGKPVIHDRSPNSHPRQRTTEAAALRAPDGLLRGVSAAGPGNGG